MGRVVLLEYGRFTSSEWFLAGLDGSISAGVQSACTGGVWGASKGGNSGEINRCFIVWYGSLEETYFRKCSEVIGILSLRVKKQLKRK